MKSCKSWKLCESFGSNIATIVKVYRLITGLSEMWYLIAPYFHLGTIFELLTLHIWQPCFTTYTFLNWKQVAQNWNQKTGHNSQVYQMNLSKLWGEDLQTGWQTDMQTYTTTAVLSFCLGHKKATPINSHTRVWCKTNSLMWEGGHKFIKEDKDLSFSIVVCKGLIILSLPFCLKVCLAHVTTHSIMRGQFSRKVRVLQLWVYVWKGVKFPCPRPLWPWRRATPLTRCVGVASMPSPTRRRRRRHLFWTGQHCWKTTFLYLI